MCRASGLTPKDANGMPPLRLSTVHEILLIICSHYTICLGVIVSAYVDCTGTFVKVFSYALSTPPYIGSLSSLSRNQGHFT